LGWGINFHNQSLWNKRFWAAKSITDRGGMQ
jgi:hypothetical protein